jgi:alpha-mannosidase
MFVRRFHLAPPLAPPASTTIQHRPMQVAPSTGHLLQAIVWKTVLRGTFQILCHETMNYQQLIVLLPCHSLEDFPTHHEGDDAAGLLAAWTALWHPALIANAGKMPSWHRADAPPENVANKLIVVPGISQSQLPSGFLQRAESESACLIHPELDRERIIETALAGLQTSIPSAAEAWTADFLALGFCFLQVELLTRKLRYSSNLDEIHFQNQVVAAAAAVMEGQADEARSRLAASFDILAMERDHYYPGEAYLLDVTMLAPTTLGERLQSQLNKPATCNLILSGELLARIARDEPQTLERLQSALREDRVGLIGGDYAPQRGVLLSCETLLAQLRHGLAQYQQTLGRRPKVYGRQRFGLTPLLPQILTKLGFDAALHASFEEGVVPEGSQAKVRWEGCDGTPLTAIARLPLDAAKPQTFLNLGVKLGEAMDMDHIATVCLAHWPGTPSPWYEDLRRISGYCSALGKFITMEEYFRTTDYPVQQDRFGYDQYRSPYLKQAVAGNQLDPISTVVRYWHRRAAAEAAQSLVTLAALATGKGVRIQDLEDQTDAAIREPLDLLTEIDLTDEVAEATELDAAVGPTLQRSLEHFAEALPRSETAAERGYLIANPHSFVRRVGLEVAGLEGLPTAARPVYSASAAAAKTQLVVDIPPMGFAWVAPGPAAGKSKKATVPLADECVLQNEFFEARIDPETGGLRAIHEYNARRNRLSQQLAFRFGEPHGSRRGEEDAEAHRPYSMMVAATIVATETLGEIVACGQLRDRQGRHLAEYRQTYRLWRGSRVLLLDVELQPEQSCTGDPWNGYYGVRFAWANEAADLSRSANLTRQTVKGKRFEAPLYIEIDDLGTRTAILTGGLPFHRRYGSRMLDTLLVVSGERCRRFQLGIGVQLKNPLHEALHLITPPPALPQLAAPPQPASSGWLFHIDARNVAATHWETVSEAGRTVGFRTRLLETQGRQAKVGVQCFRPVKTARKVNFQNETLNECQVDNGAIQLQLTAHEWAEVEARW